MTYFRTFRHYHRPWQLNGRVRNGNACDLPSVVTGNRDGDGQADVTQVVCKGDSKAWPNSSLGAKCPLRTRFRNKNGQAFAR